MFKQCGTVGQVPYLFNDSNETIDNKEKLHKMVLALYGQEC